MNNLVIENIRISLEAIRSHMLRTILTVLIIAFGIMALVGILTAIEAIKYNLTENFAMMGANTFTVRNREMNITFGGGHRNERYESITYKQALEFKERFSFPANSCIYTQGTGIATLKYESEKTNPNISVIGSDENYLSTSGLEIEKGRNFNQNDLLNSANVVIIGSEIATKLFKDGIDPVDKIISVGPGKYKVIGVLKEKGSSSGMNFDRRCILPINNVRQYFSRPNMNFSINVSVNNSEDLEPAIGEATGLFRNIRGDQLGEPDTFGIAKSDSIAQMLISLMGQVTLAATFIGLITLMGAAIGLMNIMLVSVTERTREIGIRKSMGATKKTIRNQFFVEAIVIGQIGGLLGIVLGIMIGNVLALTTGGTFIIPWMWIFVGVLLCFLVAIVSGIIPAYKAAKLDPIESLRYE